jgi:hypothetical protein
LSTATLAPRTAEDTEAAVGAATTHAPTLGCPHCKKQFSPSVDATQPPRLQGAKCPNCKLFVPARVVAAAFATV